MTKAKREALAHAREREAEEAIEFIDPPPAEEVPYPKTPPPHDLDAEAAVLSACMLDTNDGPDGKPCALTIVLDILKPEHFYSETNGRIWQAIQQLVIAKTPVDAVNIATWLRDREWLHRCGGTAYLAQISDATPAVGHVATHARTVLEKYEDRALIEACQRRAAEGYRIPGDRVAWRAEVRAELGRLTAPRVRLAGKPIGAVVDGVRARVDGINAGDIIGVPWGFRTLDAIGLLGRKRQTILAGRPGMGKTALGFQVCMNVAETALDGYGVGEAVYIASWEMPGELLLFRAACILAYVDVHKVERGEADADELERLAQAMARLRMLPIIIDDQRCTTRELGARMRQHKTLFEQGNARRSDGTLYPKCRMGLMMVDYVQRGIDGAEKPRADKRTIIGATSKGLVDIAQSQDVALLTLAMLRRVEATPDGKVRAPILDDLKESGEIEEDADTVVMIHRPQYYLRKKCPAELRGVAFMIPAKGRYGMPDETPRLGFARGKFSDQLPAAARGEPHYDDAENDNGG